MAAGAKFIPSKLSNICIRKIVENIDIHADSLRMQPFEIKDSILYLMSKRGAFTDSNIEKVGFELLLKGKIFSISYARTVVQKVLAVAC